MIDTWGDLDVVDTGKTRTIPTPPGNLIDLALTTFDVDFDLAVWTIQHPPAGADGPGVLGALIPESNPLDKAGDDHVDGDSRHGGALVGRGGGQVLIHPSI